MPAARTFPEWRVRGHFDFYREFARKNPQAGRPGANSTRPSRR
jgi:hypothetical protein